MGRIPFMEFSLGTSLIWFVYCWEKLCRLPWKWLILNQAIMPSLGNIWGKHQSELVRILPGFPVTILWFSLLRCTSCTHLLCPPNTGPCSWSTSLWLKHGWPTSRSGNIVCFGRNSLWVCPTLLCVTSCSSDLAQVAIEDMGLYEDLSAPEEAVQVLLPCLPVSSSATSLFLWKSSEVINLPAIPKLSVLPSLQLEGRGF